jgi:hypothetical protein
MTRQCQEWNCTQDRAADSFFCFHHTKKRAGMYDDPPMRLIARGIGPADVFGFEQETIAEALLRLGADPATVRRASAKQLSVSADQRYS